MHTGAPVPEGADAVVQIENTEQLSERQDGEKRIRIIKVSLAFCNQYVLNMHFSRLSMPMWAVLFEICYCLAVCFEHAFKCQKMSPSEAEAAELLPACYSMAALNSTVRLAPSQVVFSHYLPCPVVLVHGMYNSIVTLYRQHPRLGRTSGQWGQTSRLARQSCKLVTCWDLLRLAFLPQLGLQHSR